MIKKSEVILIISFFGYLFLYIFLFRNIALYNKAFCFIYLAFLLSIPIDSNRILALFVGLVTGLVIDIFNDSLGIHMAASIMMMYARYYFIRWLTPQGGYDGNALPSVTSMGLQWYLTYSVPLILIHQLCLFFIEAGGGSLFFFTLSKVLLSTLFTLFVIILLQYLFSSTAKRSL
jgi:hypothetical protein